MAKPPFNPNQPFKPATEKPAFNPNQAFEVASASEQMDNGPTPVDSLARGAAQGATLGFADEISGGVEALWEKAKGDPTEFGKLYKTFRDESRANFDEAEKANPKSYLAGEIGTGIATALVPGVAAAKGAKLASVAARAAGIGGAAGAGYSEGETASEIAKDTAKGATIGGLTTLAAPIIGKGVSKLAKGSKNAAERFAARAVGAERGTIKSIGQEGVQKAGRYALDEGIISPLASTDDMILRNQAAKARGAEKMNQVYSQIDDAGKSTFNPLEVASKVDEEIGGFYRSPINKGETNQLENTLESILMRGDKNISLKDAQALKQEIRKVANWNNNLNITDKEQMARSAYGVVSEAIDEAASKGAKSIGKDGLEEVLQQGKALYSQGKSVDKLLQNKQAREQGNKLVGLTDWGLLGGSAPVAVATGGGSIPATAAALVAKKGLEKYGSQNAALLLDKASRGLTRAPQVADKVSRNPMATQATVLAPFKGDSGALRRVADEENEKPLKGTDKWAASGTEKLIQHAKTPDQKQAIAKLKNNKSSKAKRLLITASDLKPGSKSMDKIMQQIIEVGE